jgi:hypothetical protein
MIKKLRNQPYAPKKKVGAKRKKKISSPTGVILEFEL